MKSFLIFLFLIGISNSAKATVKKIVSADSFSCALSSSGKVKCWGYNLFGQLGLGDTETRGSAPSQMGDLLPYVDLGTGVKAIDISANWQHTCILTDTGKVKCWGFNYSGQLGLGDKRMRGASPFDMGDHLPYADLGEDLRVIQISTGHDFSCALFENGKVKCWGGNQYGQLGLGDLQSRGTTPDTLGKALPFLDLGDIRAIKISTGIYSSCAVFENGKVKCWGVNDRGQLGLEDTTSRGEFPKHMGKNLPFLNLGTEQPVEEVAVGALHLCARFHDGKVKCWGSNLYGELGGNPASSWGGKKDQMGAYLPTVNLEAPAKKIHLGNFTSCALLQSNEVKCWGLNNAGQLGIGNTVNIGQKPSDMGNTLQSVGLPLPAAQIFRGVSQFCALILNGGVQCWGANTFGSLGIESPVANIGSSPADLGNSMEYTELGIDF